MNTDVTEAKVPFCRRHYNEEGVFTFSFGNGTDVYIDVNELSDEQRYNLLMHGLNAKGGDSFAGAKGDYTIGIAAVQKVCDQLMANQWNASRASAGEGAPRVGELAQAIANIKGLDVAVVTKAVTAATDEQRSAWRKNAAVAAEIAKLRAAKAAERAAKEVGTADDISL